MSLTASWLVLAVAAVRLLFRKTPKWILCLLWGLVALRLVCPVSLESTLSLVPSAEPLPPEIIDTAWPEIHSGIPAVDAAVNPVLEASLTPEGLTSANPTQIWSFLFSRVWVLGMGVMLLYTLVSYLLLKRRVCTAVPLEKGVKQSEFVDSPFVLGIYRPVIYLPFGLAEGDLAYVLAHERAHIRRHDHWWKPMGFLLLSVYWFNPVMWVAYILLCRDIEAACDEKVIRDLEPDGRRAYSTALLNCSVHRRRIAACPLAFGEAGVKARIQNVMNYKKPAFWMILTALLLSAGVAVCFLTDPKQPDSLYDRTSTLALADVESARAMLWEDGQEASFLLTEDQTQALAAILNNLEKSEFENRSTGAREKTVALSLAEGELLLTYDGTGVGLQAGEDTAWTGNAELTAFFGSVTLPDWGITVPAVEVTPEKAIMRFSRDAMSLEGRLYFDGEYRLQTWTEGGWQEVPVRDTASGFREADCEIPPNSTFGQTIYWQDRYSELSAGDYRIVKYLRLRRDSGFEEYCPYFGEFTVETPDPAAAPETPFSVVLRYENRATRLTREADYGPVLSLLTDIQANAGALPRTGTEDPLPDSIQLWEGEEKRSFALSPDGSRLWTEDRAYSLANYPQLEDCLANMTDGVWQKPTGGTPFAAKEEPWRWTRGISGGQVEQAEIYLQETIREGDSTVYGSSGGIFRTEAFSQMLEILNAIPREAFSQGQLSLGPSDTYTTLRIKLSGRGVSVSILDRVNSLAVVFRYDGVGVEMALCDDLEKVEKDQILGDTVTCWRVSDQALTEYLQSLMQDPPIVTYGA